MSNIYLGNNQNLLGNSDDNEGSDFLPSLSQLLDCLLNNFSLVGPANPISGQKATLQSIINFMTMIPPAQGYHTGRD